MLVPYTNYNAVSEALLAPDPEGESNEAVTRGLDLLHRKLEYCTAHGVQSNLR